MILHNSWSRLAASGLPVDTTCRQVTRLRTAVCHDGFQAAHVLGAALPESRRHVHPPDYTLHSLRARHRLRETQLQSSQVQESTVRRQVPHYVQF